ncbi:hypothetical protein AB5N96_11230 [Chryseomicrobium imtechense]
MNLLIEGIETKAVVANNTDKRIVIGEISKNYPVYKIRLDQLYYNDQNDRIATWISQYKIDQNIDSLTSLNREEYNQTIHKFITDSNPQALKNTQKNIKLIGQQEVGVVLYDGRIIDGNRRFTCLRNIERETGKTQYFEAVILDHTIENNAKQIKMLELMLQHGLDEKVGYNLIDKLVGIYNDIIETKLLTVKEYADSVNQTPAQINKEVEIAELLVEFLEFINAPKHFHLARTMNIASSLDDLFKMLKRVKNDDKKEDLKNIVFAQLLIQPVGDSNRFIRQIGKIVDSKKFFDDFVDEQTEIVEKVCDELEKHPRVTDKEISKIRSEDQIKKDFKHSTEIFLNRVDSDTTRNQPIKQVEKACDSIELIDRNIFKKLNDDQKDDIQEQLDRLEELILDMRKELDV